MKVFKILSPELEIGTLLYFEKERDFVIELKSNLDEWTAPLLFMNFVRNKIYTIPREFSYLWVKERIIPSGRQNIGMILNNHNLTEYDEMKFLEIAHGKCSQDDYYIKKTDDVPDYVKKRMEHNLKDCVLLDAFNILCFFRNGLVKKVNLEEIKGVENLEKVLKTNALYESGKVGSGGYCLSFNNSIDIPASVLYSAGVDVPLSVNDFMVFARSNILTTKETMDVLQCSRQNLSYLVKVNALTPVKEEKNGNLYLKGDVMKTKW